MSSIFKDENGHVWKIIGDTKIRLSILYYILDANKNPIPCENSNLFFNWYHESDSNKRVAGDIIRDYYVSTVFNGRNENQDRPGRKPAFFETMIIDEKNNKFMAYKEQYETYDQALEGHQKAIEYIKQLIDVNNEFVSGIIGTCKKIMQNLYEKGIINDEELADFNQTAEKNSQ